MEKATGISHAKQGTVLLAQGDNKVNANWREKVGKGGNSGEGLD
jgi:hypothetical protein